MDDKNRLPELIMKLGTAFSSKEEAIREACALLHSAGCVEAGYERSMLKRERAADTWLGAGLAIPHGALEDKGMVKRDGLAILQIPAGLDWGKGNTATLMVAIAAAGDSHIAILRHMTGLLQDEGRMKALGKTRDAAELKAAFLSRTEGPEEALPDFALSREWVLDYPAGLHARPGLIWSEAAQESGALLRVRHEKRSADPRRLVALLHLGLRAGDTLTISADGPNAAEALERFLRVIGSLSAQEQAQAASAAEPAARTARRRPSWAEGALMECIGGVAASPGFCFGRIFSVGTQDAAVPDVPMGLERGAALLEEAVGKAKQQLKAVMDDTTRRLGPTDAAIFKTHRAFLEDRDLISLCASHIVNGYGPAWAWKTAVEDIAKSFEGMDNPVLAARAADLRDAGRRVLGFMLPEAAAAPRLRSLPDEKAILLAKDLSPADMAELDPEKTLGIITVFGSPASHMAILARTLGIPTVVACGPGILAVADGETVILDGDDGFVCYKPSPQALEAAGAEQAKREQRRQEQRRTRSLPAKTLDGRLITVSANINNADQVPPALDMGAEGVGLMRTEFLFLERDASPGEEEQTEAYRAMAKALDHRSLIIRALDIGGDKQIAQLNLDKEENPFMGVRGARLLLRRLDLLLPQLRAVYRSAGEYKNIKLMFPMITSLKELRELKDRCEAVRKELDAPPIPLGVMIEVPAAAILSGVLAREADFFSIGTNDLTQYTLAMDRQNPVLAEDADGLHPAVLNLIKATMEGAKAHTRHVGVCGGIAGDPQGALLLAGLGVDELSMTPRDIPAIKEAIREHSAAELAERAASALLLESPSAVRSLDGRPL